MSNMIFATHSDCRSKKITISIWSGPASTENFLYANIIHCCGSTSRWCGSESLLSLLIRILIYVRLLNLMRIRILLLVKEHTTTSLYCRPVGFLIRCGSGIPKSWGSKAGKGSGGSKPKNQSSWNLKICYNKQELKVWYYWKWQPCYKIFDFHQ